mmetsp:Transcript_4042/g.9255  ORF Transcript_4042/g.9255 Transcript_4042/m.9255 type:complete len:701 (-) Transcript_4042:6-2108(-)
MEAQPQSKPRHVIIVGAGVSGLALALRLARRWSRYHYDEGGTNAQEDDATTSPCDASFTELDPSTSSLSSTAIPARNNPGNFPSNDVKSECKNRRRRLDVKRLLEITILEAHEFVGGRVRSIRTASTTMSSPAASSFLALSPSNHEEYRRRYQKFVPWVIPLGAEFVHGDEGNTALVNDIIHKMQNQNSRQSSGQDGIRNSSNDDDDYDDCDEDWNNRNLHEMSQDETTWDMDLVLDYGMKTPNLTIFADGRCFHWRTGKEVVFDCANDSNADIDDDNVCTSSEGWQKSIQSAKHIWDDILRLEHDPHIVDMTLEEYVIRHYHSKKTEFDVEGLGETIEFQKTLAILNAVYAATAGTTARKMGIKEASRQENAWPYGDSNYRLSGCFSELIDYYLAELDVYNPQTHAELSSEARAVSVSIITNCQVTAIESKPTVNQDIHLVSSDGQIFECDRVAISVPLAVLKANSINFKGNCELPPQKQLAIRTINVMPGGKVHALLKWGVDLVPLKTDLYTKRLLNERVRGIFVCPQEEQFSQVWFRWKDGHSILATGFYVYCECDRAIDLNGFGNNGNCSNYSLENKFKSIVERILSNRLGSSIFAKKDHDDAAAITFSAFDEYDWSGDMHARGLYSSPSVDVLDNEVGATSTSEKLQCHNHLATPLSNRIFFAGEHMHTETNATVQSAIETGICAADDILDSLVH